ncbi:hypothetical protein HMI55_005208 [Coelomomyces lativittatus]|nr:hypothetical protein HMI55_005208 [Coelomomyces lativittatus]
MKAAKATHQQHISPDQLANLKSSHLLLTKVYQHVPSLLSNVIPHLEEEMVTENSHFRLLAIQTIGTMLTQRHDFHKHFPQTWKSWLNRRNDKVLELRLLWLSFIPSIYNVHANTVSLDLNPCLEQKLIDVDDHVRYAACECISKIQFDVIKSCMTRSFLDALGSRIKDKSFKVRFQAINTIGQLWKQLMRVLLPSSEDNENDPSLKRPTYRCPLEEEEVQEWLALFGGLPSSILASAYLNANDLTAILENTLIDQVVHPKEVKSDDWKLQILRLLWFLSCVREDPRALQAMYSVLQRQFITIQELRLFFQLILEKASISTEEEKNAWTHRMQCLLQLMNSGCHSLKNS